MSSRHDKRQAENIAERVTGVRDIHNHLRIVVPADHYLMLGDNRDNSLDSRFFGLVSRASIIGRAERILVSADYKDSWALRLDRFGKTLH